MTVQQLTSDWGVLLPVILALVLLIILIISFRSRAVVFCQYLRTMSGVRLEPKDVRRAYSEGGPEGVRELFLDLIIRADLEKGPLQIPDDVSFGSGADTTVE